MNTVLLKLLVPGKDVFLAVDGSSGRRLAVKRIQLPSASEPNNRSEHEVAIAKLKLLKHENFIKYVEMREIPATSLTPDIYEVVMDYYNGGTLHEACKSQQSLQTKVRWTLEILHGLAYLHKLGMSHDQLNCRKVLLSCPKFDEATIKLCAPRYTRHRVSSSGLSEEFHSAGAMAFLAREAVVDGQWSAAGDIWGVGCIVIQMFTGLPPQYLDNGEEIPHRETMKIFGSIEAGNQPVISDILPEKFKLFVQECLNLDAKNRPSAEQLLSYDFLTSSSVETSVSCGLPSDLQGRHSAKRKKHNELPATPKNSIYTGHKHQGKALIINNVNFDDPKHFREGATKDTTELQLTLEQIGFQSIQVLSDQSAKEMFDAVERFAEKEDFTEVSSCFCIIMTHGDLADTLLGRDGNEVRFSTVLDSFKEKAAVNRSLIGKPKIFLIQACRGSRKDYSLSLRTDSVSEGTHFSVEQDYMIVFATPPGFVAWRNPLHGSIFIQSFCTVTKQLFENSKKGRVHFHKLITKVSSQVHQNVIELQPGRQDVFLQVVVRTDSLTKEFYLTAKLTGTI